MHVVKICSEPRDQVVSASPAFQVIWHLRMSWCHRPFQFPPRPERSRHEVEILNGHNCVDARVHESGECSELTSLHPGPVCITVVVIRRGHWFSGEPGTPQYAECRKIPQIPSLLSNARLKYACAENESFVVCASGGFVVTNNAIGITKHNNRIVLGGC